MKILYKGKTYKATQDKDARLMITVDKKKVFAGFGEGNMNYGFRIAPKEKDDTKL